MEASHNLQSPSSSAGAGVNWPISDPSQPSSPLSDTIQSPVNQFDWRKNNAKHTVVAGPLASPIHIEDGRNRWLPMPSSAQIEGDSPPDYGPSLLSQQNFAADQSARQSGPNPQTRVERVRIPRAVSEGSSQGNRRPSQLSPTIITPDQGMIRGVENMNLGPKPQSSSNSPPATEHVQQFQYHHQHQMSDASASSNGGPRGTSKSRPESRMGAGYLSAPNSRPGTSYSLASDPNQRGRKSSPAVTGHSNLRTPSRHSPDVRNSRPISVADLQALPYAQQHAPPMLNLNQAGLQSVVGSNVSLLSRKKTLEMYRNNIKKTTDVEVQYGFATFLVETAQMLKQNPDEVFSADGEDSSKSANELLSEARNILQRMADRSYPFAQYYLADGLANGTLNKGKEDDSSALPLFVSASKHGHAESAYRAALCYEYGWGMSKNPTKAIPYLRQAASKNHPGAMFRLAMACLKGDMGDTVKYREGIKWLKRAAEAADGQYNSAPYELGCLHEVGYGDDVFKDESYAAQLFTQSAELGHVEANYRLGDAYEHGKLMCPKDNALSIHFYHGAAARGHATAAMSLCAWYMVGAPPVLEKDENEAFEWAKKAAEAGLAKAQYATGYFTEMGIGCRRDPLEANVWYVRAAEQDDERAKRRLTAIQAVASGRADPALAPLNKELPSTPGTRDAKQNSANKLSKNKKRFGVF